MMMVRHGLDWKSPTMRENSTSSSDDQVRIVPASDVIQSEITMAPRK